jgi:hypothetical protein
MTSTALSPSQVTTVPAIEARCDGCGANAKLAFELAAGGELALCGHHANRMVERIAATAVKIRLEEGFAWSGAPQI